MSLPTLAGDRVRLRATVPDDGPDVLALFGNPKTAAMTNIGLLSDLADAQAFIARLAAHADTGDLFQWGIVGVPSDRVIGTVTLASIDRTHHRAELGYALAPEQRGQGRATEAVRLALAHAFDALEMHRIEADVDPNNAPSIALLERLGFTREGYRRERWFMDGEWQDTVDYGLLASRWRQAEPTSP